MTRATIAGGAFATVILLLAAAAGYRAFEQDDDPAPAASPALPPSATPAAAGNHPPEAYQGFLYGRVTTVDGASYQGRLRWGGGQEAFWDDYFNGTKHENPWLAQAPPGQLPKERRPVEIFGFEISSEESQIDIGRLFMVRFGEITRIEARGGEVRVTLKNGTGFNLDRFEASDFDDGLWVWEGGGNVVKLDDLRLRTIELLPTPPLGDAPGRLHGTVRTRQGDFTGFIQWDREECVGSDALDGHTDDGKLGLRFDTIRSISRRSRDSSLVTLTDGREVVLSDTPEVGDGNRGVYVDDRRYGRVLVSWDAFERVDFSPGGSGPAYGDFPPGHPLTGRVTTHDGRRLAGRLVYGLDESETIETLDAPSRGVDYIIPFGLIASIVPPGRGEGGVQSARVALQNGEELQLERTGDFGERTVGLLIFAEGGQRPEYVPWADVERVDFTRPPAMYPPAGG